MYPLILSAWLWLCPPCGAPADAVVEVAPMPRPVPALRVPERWGPRVVIPPDKGKGE